MRMISAISSVTKASGHQTVTHFPEFPTREPTLRWCSCYQNTSTKVRGCALVQQDTQVPANTEDSPKAHKVPSTDRITLPSWSHWLAVRKLTKTYWLVWGLLFIRLFFKQTFIGHLICVRYCSQLLGHINKQNKDRCPCRACVQPGDR